MFPTLETERLILREITYDDAEGIFACFSNDIVTRFYGQDSLETMIKQEILWIFSLKTLKRKKEFVGELKEKAKEG